MIRSSSRHKNAAARWPGGILAPAGNGEFFNTLHPKPNIMALTNYKQSDMVYNDYKSTAKADHDNPDITGWPDNVLFSRYEIYEMLHFINAFAKANNWDGNPIQSYQNLERILREKLPSDIRSHKNVAAWIHSNYERI